MLSLTDCLDFIDLDRNTIEVIARHECLPEIVAAELGNQLITDLRGISVLHRMHRELLASAVEEHNPDDEKWLGRVYSEFRRKYPLPSSQLAA